MFIEHSIVDYLSDLLPPRDAILSEMEAVARDRQIAIVGPEGGRFLFLLLQSAASRRVFEMGGGIGYATQWLARGVGPHGHVYYTEKVADRVEEARDYLERADLAERVEIIRGESVELLEQTVGPFDLILLDHDPCAYPESLEAALPRLRHGGLLVATHALYQGRVVDPDSREETTRAVQAFNRRLFGHPDLFATILPIGDGLAVAKKMAGNADLVNP